MSAFDVEQTMRPRSGKGDGARLWLTIIGDLGVQTQALPREGRLTIGRASDASIRIEDNSMSRYHAALVIEGDHYTVEDLGSLNGTVIGDRTLSAGEKVAVRVGESFVVGDSTLILQNTPPPDRPRRILSHSQLELCLESECTRANEGDAPFALARVELEVAAERDPGDTGRSDNAISRLERVFATGLRQRDLLGTYARGVYEILFIGIERATAAPLLAELERQATQQGLRLRTALAVFPTDGRSPEELVDALSRLSRAARPGGRAEERGTSAPDSVTPLVRRVAQSQINVLIFGETGAGKEVMARTLHELSPRATKPLVSINCAALSETLLEGELFGFEKGAFTGAAQAKAGVIESADGGTLFLDEIGELPIGMQAKLLRVIEMKQVQRLGAVRPRDLDVRFVAATHRDLDAEVLGGRFRQDLLFRLNGMSLVVPPLRERADEIEPLADLFLSRFAEQMELSPLPVLSAEARRVLHGYRWPGNVRELRNVMERALVLCTDGVITPNELPLEKLSTKMLDRPTMVASRNAPAPPPVTSPSMNLVTSEQPILTRSGAAADQDRAAIKARVAAESGAERQKILDALDASGGNQTEAATLLGISRRTLINRIEQYDIPRPRKR